MQALEAHPKNLRVLIVDDSDVILTTLKHFFEEYAIEVMTCVDGLEGLQKAVEWKPSLIFLDLMMPNFDGLKMLQVKKVLQEIKDIPVIVISANTDRRNVLAAIEAGADKVLSKPLQKDMVIKFVNEVLGEKLIEQNKVVKLLSDDEKKDMKQQLLKVFFASLAKKKNDMLLALKTRNSRQLKAAMHELKGSGSTVGLPEISALAADIERRDVFTDTDWMYVELQYEKLMQLLKKLELQTKE